ncbi:TolC family protein [Robertkochia flava]|uniref:TolC family protein n=1 Tax=Robertkochia flava TaxID=3447986 RepID=UPI001CCD2CF3|nr:TolC family protein [Robertkochia marina]
MKHTRYLLALALSLTSGFTIYAQDPSPLLQTYILQALEHNPDLASSRLAYEISKEKTEEVNALPNTEFGVGYFVSEPETRTGAQRARFSVKQMIPWFGNISARQNFTASLADAQALEVLIRERKLILELSGTYYRLYALKKKMEVVSRQLTLTDSYEQLALSGLETGKGSAVSVFKIQIRKNELENKLALLKQQTETETVRFHNLTGTESTAPVTLPDTLMLQVEAMDMQTINLDLHPELVKFEEMYESVVQSEELNKKEAAPNLGFGLDYIPVEKRTDMNPADNGKDIIMPMVSVTIPLFNKKYRSVSRQNDMKIQSLEFDRQERRNRLETVLYEAVNSRTTARINTETLQKNIREAENAMEILLRSYETGTIDFNELLDIQDMQLRFEMSLIDEVRSYYNESLIINYLSTTT